MHSWYILAGHARNQSAAGQCGVVALMRWRKNRMMTSSAKSNTKKHIPCTNCTGTVVSCVRFRPVDWRLLALMTVIQASCEFAGVRVTETPQGLVQRFLSKHGRTLAARSPGLAKPRLRQPESPCR
eukprot:1534779-Rhodomonas_salina.1